MEQDHFRHKDEAERPCIGRDDGDEFDHEERERHIVHKRSEQDGEGGCLQVVDQRHRDVLSLIELSRHLARAVCATAGRARVRSRSAGPLFEPSARSQHSTLP